MTQPARALYQSGTHLDNAGATIFMSAVGPTIFGQDAADYDFMVTSEPSLAISAIHEFSEAYSHDDENRTMAAFLNATIAGTMTVEQASNITWLCSELHADMRPHVTSCAGLQTHKARDGESLAVETRWWKWASSKSHVSRNFAVNVLAGVIGNAVYANFPESPRSLCTVAQSVTACISWSKVEAFNHYYTQQLVQDAMSAVDFNTYSAKSYGVIGSKKRSAADCCFSNRVTHC